MVIDALKEKLEKREKIFSTMLCHLGFTKLPGLYKSCGLDMLVMDLEHGSFNPETIGDFLQMCNQVGLPVITRVQDCEYHCISKPIDMGADGVLIPRTESMEQVETAISSMRFYPYGKKGVGGRGLLRPGEDVDAFNKNRLLFLQIESKLGTDLLDEMLTKYGDQIAGIIIGPNDMAVSMGCGLNINAEPVVENIRKTIAICDKHQKSIGIFMDDDKVAERWYMEGMNIFWVGVEETHLAMELKRNRSRIDSFRKDEVAKPFEGYLTTKPWEAYMEPFRIFGNLYFVGNRYVSSHVIDTGDGLILLDSNYPQCTYLVTEGMRKLGLDPMDIKYILHSHGHYDHIGGTKALVELTGAKTIIGKADAPYVDGTVELTWAQELGFEYIEQFKPDILLEDGDVFTCGKTSIRAVSTPGHTEGTMSYFFNVDDGVNTYTAAMFGGAGVNSMTNGFLQARGLPLSLRDTFRQSLDKVRNEKVDVLIGNHPGDVDTAGKWARMKNGEPNPFIDTTALDRRLAYITKQFEDMIASGV